MNRDEFMNKGGPKTDMAQSIQDANNRILEEIADLEFRSKPLCELVVIVSFTVEGVVAETQDTAFIPHSEVRFGGSFSVYEGGYTSNLVLKVLPANQDIPIRTINFKGTSAVKAGDYISAQIPRYEKKEVAPEIYSRQQDQGRVFYIDRAFNSEESAIALILCSEKGCPLREDRAVNYQEFVKS